MRLDLSTEFLKSHQMRNLMDERHQKPVFIEVGVDRNLVLAAHSLAIIAMPCDALVDNFEMHSLATINSKPV
jgi:hypothetical protein